MAQTDEVKLIFVTTGSMFIANSVLFFVPSILVLFVIMFYTLVAWNTDVPQEPPSIQNSFARAGADYGCLILGLISHLLLGGWYSMNTTLWHLIFGDERTIFRFLVYYLSSYLTIFNLFVIMRFIGNLFTGVALFILQLLP